MEMLSTNRETGSRLSSIWSRGLWFVLFPYFLFYDFHSNLTLSIWHYLIQMFMGSNNVTFHALWANCGQIKIWYDLDLPVSHNFSHSYTNVFCTDVSGTSYNVMLLISPQLPKSHSLNSQIQRYTRTFWTLNNTKIYEYKFQYSLREIHLSGHHLQKNNNMHRC